MKTPLNKKIFTIPVIFCCVSVILGFVSFSLFREIMRNRTIDNEIRKVEEEAGRLEVKNLEILELVKELEDTDFLEKEARLKLGLQKQDEKVVVINRVNHETGILNYNLDKFKNIINPAKWWFYFFRNPEKL